MPQQWWEFDFLSKSLPGQSAITFSCWRSGGANEYTLNPNPDKYPFFGMLKKIKNQLEPIILSESDSGRNGVFRNNRITERI
jgi:hypothetical protein